MLNAKIKINTIIEKKLRKKTITGIYIFKNFLYFIKLNINFLSVCIQRTTLQQSIKHLKPN